MGLSRNQEQELVALLEQCTPGNLPSSVFEAIARVAVYPAIELVPYARSEKNTSVGLLRRPQDDPFWPDMWHIPGTVFRPTDRTFDDAFGRLSSDEFKSPAGVSPELFSVNLVPYRRGGGLTVEHAIDMTGYEDSTALTFFSVDALPESFIEEQKTIIDRFKSFIATK